MMLGSPRFFRLEFAAILGVWLLYLQYGYRYANWPRLRAVVHFLFILVFAEIGICGVRVAIELVFGTSRFLETFRQPNLLFLPSGWMCWLAGAYALAGTVFYIAVMFLGEMSPKGRRVFYMLVGPCTVLYPAIMGNLTQASGILLRSPFAVVAVFMTFAVIGGIGVGAFRSNEVLQATAAAPRS